MDDSDDERPSFGRGGLGAGGAGFGLGFNADDRERSDSPSSDAQENNGAAARPSYGSMRGGRGNAAGAEGAAAPASGGPSSRGAGRGGAGKGFAAKMMAKMGYKEGVGLGKEGHGRLAPIDVQLRPQGVGLGLYKEKTKQAKEEERRVAALTGQTVEEDSEEEERKRRKAAKRRRQEQGLPTIGVGRQAKLRTKYRTAAEIESESGGLEVPNVLKDLIDLSGKRTSFTQTPELNTLVPQETEAEKIAKRARRDLEAFEEEWKHAKLMKSNLDLEAEQLVVELDQEELHKQSLRAMADTLDGLHELSLVDSLTDISSTGEVTEEQWEALTKRLELIEIEYKDEIDKYGIHEAAVAAVESLFKPSMLSWDPLAEPAKYSEYLRRLQHVLGAQISTKKSVTDGAVIARDEKTTFRASKRSTTVYETLLYNNWLPRVRSALTNDWQVADPEKAISLIQAWGPLLPEFILNHVIRQFVIPRLSAAVSAWKPSRKSASMPHHWLFPWLYLLSPSQLDTKLDGSLATTLRRRVRSNISNHPMSEGMPKWLFPLISPIFSERMLKDIAVQVLMPRLSKYLVQTFKLNPAQQDMEPFDHVLSFLPLFSHSSFAELLRIRLFPMLYSTLHTWLTERRPDYLEIQQWLEWWQHHALSRELQPELRIHWNAALRMVNDALELGSAASSRLPGWKNYAATASSEQHEAHKQKSDEADASAQTQADSAAAQAEKATENLLSEITFRDIVEDFCAEHGLLLVSLREAHPITGAPLLRITASANARGGVIAYVQGDLLFVRHSRFQQGTGSGTDPKLDSGAATTTQTVTWEATGLDEALVQAAGGSVGSGSGSGN